MPARHLILGLDGADLDLVLAAGSGALPHLHALMERGVWARMRTVHPPATLPNWTSFLTGVNPGKHGVFDFTTRRGYSVRFQGGSAREVATWAARLDALGRSVACIAFPGTWPPERLQHGVFVSGWDSPVASEADRSFVWPPAIYDRLAAHGAHRFDTVDEFQAGTAAWYESLAPALSQRVNSKCTFALELLQQSFDVFAIYFGESDTAAHHLWAHHDAHSPRHLTGHRAADALVSVYRSLDDAVGRILAAAGADAEVTVVSDHGSGGSSTQVFYLNRFLAEKGWLSFRPPAQTSLLKQAKSLALSKLPPRLRERLFRAGNGFLPSLLESQTRFGGIDFSKTLAFSDELNYFPALYLNRARREPNGFVAPADAPHTIQRLRQLLLQARAPWGGPVFQAVHRREDLYEGPHRERAPDLILEPALIDGYSLCMLPSDGPGPAFATLDESEYLGKKGRSLPGSHRERGLFIAAGPSIAPLGEIDASILDAAATMLFRTGVHIPSDWDGRVLFECLGDNTASETLPHVPLQRGEGDESALEKKLRALGYVD